MKLFFEYLIPKIPAIFAAKARSADESLRHQNLRYGAQGAEVSQGKGRGVRLVDLKKEPVGCETIDRWLSKVDLATFFIMLISW